MRSCIAEKRQDQRAWPAPPDDSAAFAFMNLVTATTKKRIEIETETENLNLYTNNPSVLGLQEDDAI